MTRHELEALIEVAFQHAREKLIGRRGPLKPTFLFIGPTGEREIVETPFHNHFEKPVIALTMRVRMREKGTAAYVFISENWSAPAPAGWRFGQPLPAPLSEHPERVETVIAITGDRETEATRRWKIRRDSTGAIEALDEWAVTGVKASGRFGGLLWDNDWQDASKLHRVKEAANSARHQEALIELAARH
jgi:hypothetical protein